MSSGDARVQPVVADGDLVPFDPRPLTVDDLDPGDLVFVRAERTPLGAVIGELDGCGFSHVGVLDRADDAARTPALLSARTSGGVGTTDFGGVRRNDLAALAGRGLFVAPLTDGVDRAAGLEQMREWLEGDGGPDHESRSRFSFAKLVVVCAALAAVRRRRPLGVDAAQELWDAALDAVAALPWDGGVPGFYCAEAVAAAYRLHFTADALWVRDGEPHPVGLPALVVEDDDEDTDDEDDDVVDLRGWIARVAALRDLPHHVGDMREALTDIGFATEQARAMGTLLWTLWRYDPDLFDRLVESARELRGRRRPGAGRRDPEPAPTDPFVPPGFLSAWPDVLAPALVTPRMLLSGSVVTSVHELRL